MTIAWSAYLKKLYAGDRAGIEDLYALTSSRVFTVITDILGTSSDASDVLEQVYMAVWQDRETWEASTGPTGNDICRLAHRLALKTAYATKSKDLDAHSARAEMDGSIERRGNDDDAR